MKKILILFIALLALLLPLQAQDDETSFNLFSEDAVVTRDNFTFTDPGAVMVHDGTYYMFHNKFARWPGRVSVYLSTSEDGLNWEAVNRSVIFNGEDIEYVGTTLLASSVLVEDDGTWVMYFYNWETSEGMAPVSIGRATAPSPEGPWVADPELILLPGSEGEWDALQVTAPDVIRAEDGSYLMYYTGVDEDEILRIGMATSEDGINWTKYDDPQTTEAPFAESDPILAAFDHPEILSGKSEVWQPRVQLTPDGYVMLLKNGGSFYDRGAVLNFAYSEDGVDWAIEYSETPPVKGQVIDRGNAIWFADLLHNDNTYFVYSEIGSVDEFAGYVTEVYVSTYRGSLRD